MRKTIAAPRSWKSRAVDYMAYTAIGLLLVGVTLVAADRIQNPSIATQIVTAVFSGCIIVAWLIKENWKVGHRQVLFTCCAVVLLVHFGAYVIAFQLAGVTKAFVAGPATILEIAAFSYTIGRVLRKYGVS